MNVLIVEDKEENLYYLSTLLNGHGYGVEMARHGAEALEKAREMLPDMVVSDLLMPVMDGYTLLRHWKADEKLGQVPFVVYTATYTEERDERLAIDLGADAFILKPCEPDVLMLRLAEVKSQMAGSSPARPKVEAEDQAEMLKVYNETLIQKLEEKTLQLEEANRALASDIEARIITEAALREKEEEASDLARRLCSTLESLTDGFFTLNRDWRFTYVNAEAERLTRKSRLQLLGWSIWDAFPEAKGTISQTEYERAMRDNVPVQFEVFYPPLETWFDVRAFPSPQSLAVHFRDITDVRRAAEDLKMSEERFRLLSKATNDAIWDWDIGTNELWWNEGLEALFGYRPEDMEPTVDAWAARIHAGDRERVVASINRSLDDGSEGWMGEYCFVCKDGAHAFVLDRGHIIRDANGRAVRMIGGMTDITERRRAVQKLLEQATLLDKAQDAILVRDMEHRVRYWNRSAERLYGWTTEEALGRSVKEMLYRDPTEFLAATASVLTLGEWTGELQQVTKDGQPLVIEAHWTLVTDDHGRPKSILAINTDITQRKKLEAQFLRAQRMESIGTLAGGIAHDLNNVLAPIMMSIDLLKLKITDPASRETLATIGRSAQRGAEMVSQVLSFARGMEGRRVEVQVKHVIRDLIKITADTFPKNIRIEEKLGEDLWTMEADPTQLHQVLLNLCVNARDAMPEGGLITISAENMMIDQHYSAMNIEARIGPHVKIEVEDSGTGIPKRIVDKIFDPFFTTKEVGKGTGLGLATSLAIVKSHGGFIRVYSDAGMGSKFRIYLPAVAGTTEPSADLAEINLPRGNNETVMVVDDEASVRQITKQTLEAFGYRVLLASDGSEAISMYVNHQSEIAVVLTDMMMPVMDGPATIRVLMRLNPNVRIIGASGITANGKVAQSVGIGVKHFLPKPYTAETLLKAIKKVLMEVE